MMLNTMLIIGTFASLLMLLALAMLLVVKLVELGVFLFRLVFPKEEEVKPLTLEDILDEVFDWSIDTFGDHTQRGPIGPLRHMLLEIDEVADAKDRPSLRTEIADLMILMVDAAWRSAPWFSYRQFDANDIGNMIVRHAIFKAQGRLTALDALKSHVEYAILCGEGQITDENRLGIMVGLADVIATNGFDSVDIIEAAFEKVEINRAREWNVIDSSLPIQHIRRAA